jgi:sodium-dependent dicarboxylate transporter 2/3/5
MQFESLNGKDKVKGFAAAMVLGVAYASSIGGIATLIGTVPNMVFVRIFESSFPLAPKISFTSWMLVALPISTVLIFATWLLLRFLYFRSVNNLGIDKESVKSEYSSLGRMSFEEKVVASLMTMTALLWIFRSDILIGAFTIPGWSNLLAFGKMIDDSTIVVFTALLMFFIPSRSAKGEFIANSEMLVKIPWDVIILFGGGFAISDAFQSTGLAKIISSNLSVLNNANPFLVIVVICTLLTFLTELTSNTATTQTVLPILAATAVAMQINPLLFMIPATISASMAFMLPVATPPNAIIFGTGRIRIIQMAKTGFILNWIGVIVISLMFYYLGMLVFGIEPSVFPVWGK